MCPPVPPLGATMITTTTAAMLGAVVAVVAGAALVPAMLPPAHAAAGEPGTLVLSFGEYDRHDRYWSNPGPYEFASLRDMAILPDGKIVVLDGRDRYALRVFHPNGTLYFGVDFTRILNGAYQDFVSVAPDGNIFVHANRGTVKVFSPNGTHVSTFRPLVPGSPDYQIHGPIVFAPNGNFVVSNWCNGDFAFNVFHPNGTHAFSFGPCGGYHGEVGSGQLAIAPDGKMFVDDGDDHFIHVFHPNGTYAAIMPRFAGWSIGSYFAIGPAGEFIVHYRTTPGPMNVYYMYYPNGTRAAVVSMDGYEHGQDYGKFVKFGPTGDILARGAGSNASVIGVFNGIEPEDVWSGPSLLYGPPWPPAYGPPAYGPPAYGPPAYGPPAYGPPAARPLSLAGGAFAFEFGSYGEGPGEFLAPRNIAFGPGGVIAVSDAENNRIQLFHPNGTFAFELGSRGSGPGEMSGPYGLTFGPNGLLAVSDVGNHRVQVFRIQ